MSQRPQKRKGDQHDRRRAGQSQPGKERVEREQEWQQYDERRQIEERAQQLAGEEFADLVYFHDLVHRFAGGVPFEIVEWKPQQAVEYVQVQLRVKSRADNENDQPAREAEKDLE